MPPGWRVRLTSSGVRSIPAQNIKAGVGYLLMRLANFEHKSAAGPNLKYQPAKVQQVIAGWRTISTESIARRYNGGGDPYYSKKLDYALRLVNKGEDAICE